VKSTLSPEYKAADFDCVVVTSNAGVAALDAESGWMTANPANTIAPIPIGIACRFLTLISLPLMI
jgi:hypothetical protein